MKQSSHLYLCGSSPWLHSRITCEALKTPEDQTTPRAMTAGALGVDPGIRNFFEVPSWFQYAAFAEKHRFIFCMHGPEWSSIRCPESRSALESQQEGAFRSMRNWGEDTGTCCVCAEAPSRDLLIYGDIWASSSRRMEYYTAVKRNKLLIHVTTMDESQMPYVR